MGCWLSFPPSQVPQQRKLMGSSFSPEQLRCVLVQAPGQVQQGSGEGSEGSGEGLGGFGASQVRFNRFNRVPKFPEKVLEKLLGSIGEKPSQVQRG